MTTIPAGQWSAPVTIYPINDDLVEGMETVVVELQPVACPAIWPPDPSCYEVGHPARAIAFIRDNDVAENHPPKVVITHPLEGDIFESGQPVPISIVAKDPDGWVRRIVVFDGHEKIAEQEVTFVQPPQPGEEQNFEFTWEDAAPGPHVLTAVVVDNDGARSVSEPVNVHVKRPTHPPIVTVHARDPFAREPASNVSELNPAVFRVCRSGDTVEPLEVHYRLRGSAENGVDFQERNGVIVIPEGRRSAAVEIIPIPDDLEERIETVIIGLISPPSADAASILEAPPYLVGRPGKAAAIIADPKHPRPDCRVLEDGSISLCLPGEAGFSYRLEVSYDMQKWHEVETNTVGGDGRIQYIETDPGNFEKRFYRIMPATDEIIGEE